MSLQAEIEGIVGSARGVYGVAAKNLLTGDSVALRADEGFNTASVIKVAVMVELYARAYDGEVRLTERIELEDEQRAGGSGLFGELDTGMRPTLRDLCVAMIVVSDNTATNMLIARLGLPAINARLAGLGLERTRLHRPIRFEAPAPGEPPGLGLTTPREMLRLWEALARGEVVCPEASARMLGVLSRQQHRDMIPRFLPVEYDAVTRESEPGVAHKTGSVDGVRNDVGLVTFRDGRRWVVSAFSRELEDLSWTPENEGVLTLARISRAIYDAWA